eukprot:TRINITY_DN19904_c0_g1_i1.p1 TRINITY_DN19904_c0_g1~~TRINITY_DN19904_c0_g1_i1.p1  ORF type:complete len:412 (+),score=131.44 TRINITY_DN19904_c0_g1_i1:73-1308(+)
MKVLILALLVGIVSGTILFEERFGAGWEDRWVESTSKGEEAGKWVHTAGEFFNDEEADKGIQTGEDARFYQISAAIPEFSNKDKTLVLQYRVKNEQNLDCGGGYIKLLPAGLDQTTFNGDSDYNIMFGPDKCGSTQRIHAILNYKDENHLINKNPYPATDSQRSHVYTFVLNADQTYEIWLDGETKEEGSITDDWSILPPKQIPDPAVSKPEDWVDEARIADPEAVKPENWDDIPAEIADPEAEMPEDWDEELDGEWEAPTIRNPEYQGEWRAPMIDNPDYVGPWEHPLIDNPEYFEDAEIYAFDSHAFVGFELWQVTAGTIFSDILVADDVADARAYIDGYFQTLHEAEEAGFEKAEEERIAAEEAAAAEAEEAEAEEEGFEVGSDDDDEGSDDDDDDEGSDDHGHEHDF